MKFAISTDKMACLLAITLVFNILVADAQTKTITIPKPGSAFKSGVKSENLDPATYADWVDGVEKHIQTKEEKQSRPEWVLWTDKTNPGYNGVTYGTSKKPGIRHLRIGLLSEVAIGTIIADGGGRPSVLKSGVAYPGNLNNDADWLPAKRIVGGQISDKESSKAEFALWVFPAGTKSRAIRFTHKPLAADENYEGWLGGAVITQERYINIAPQAIVSTKSNNHQAKLLTNGISDNWAGWANRDEKELPGADVPVISKINPEWILLTWSQPVKISKLLAPWVGFGTAEVQTYKGPANQHARDAGESQWQTIAGFTGIESTLNQFWPNVLDLGTEITTSAIRIKLTGVLKNPGAHMASKNQDGKRVWAGEIMALQSIAGLPLQPYNISSAEEQMSRGTIAVPFTLKEAGYVTLVIEDKKGIRIRNLISEEWYNAGKNITWWDGMDDLGRNVEAARHGIYMVPSKLVAPGAYKVHGLVHAEINTSYEFPVYTTGVPPWSTDDHTGAWLANHTPPQAAVFVPAKQSPTGAPTVFLGNYVTEGPDGLAWVDLDGNKLGGKKWIGGNWTAAPYLARDAGKKAAADTYVYVGSVWETGKQSGEMELRITALTAGADKPIILHNIGPRIGKSDMGLEMGGLAVHNGIAVASLSKKDELLIVNVNTRKVVGKLAVKAPKGLAFDDKGQLLVLSENKLIRYSSIQDPERLPNAQTVISSGLEDPVGLTLDVNGGLYISDAGKSHQVKVFTAEGKFVRAIGKQGLPEAGPYDQLHMNNPAGIAIDSKQQLWVTENDYLPKRVSVWTLDGNFIKAFYGPAKYGGGGTIDPQDKSRFYYAEETRGAMEFKIDWKTGESHLQHIIYRKQRGSLDLGFRGSGPETPLYNKGKRYFTNCYSSNPTGGSTTAFLFADRDGIAYPVAAMGKLENWDVLKEEKFKSVMPADVDVNAKGPKSMGFFIWADLNGDTQVQPAEVAIQKGNASGITVMHDLSFCVAQLNGKAMQFMPVSFTDKGVPVYKMDQGKILAQGVQGPGSSGGNQVLAAPGGWTIATLGILPFERYSISGTKDGKAVWSYPNLWPGLHASHEAPLPGFSGQLIGPTRLLGGLMEVKGAESGPLWAVNSNHGMVYVFTSDGLFVSTLFEPMRSGKRWRMPAAERGMSLKGLSLGEENFWPNITQTIDGSIYIVDGSRSSVVKVEGLESIKRLPVSNLTITKDDLEKSRLFQVKVEGLRQKSQGSGLLKVLLKAKPIIVDGKFDEWTGAEWVDIDKSGVKANFNSNSKPYNVTGAISVSGDRLYLGYRTGDADLLKNTGEMAVAPFKTGGALDLMIGTDPASNPDRQAPVAGDLRLLVTIVKGKPHALIYRAVVAGTKQADKVPFASPWRTITFDKVADVSTQVEFSTDKSGDYEVSVPLSVLNLKPKAGMHIKGDIGILRGDGAQTISRVYWTNKATGIVSDVPAEAELTPGLWGKLVFENHE